jgi:hypothetical protein
VKLKIPGGWTAVIAICLLWCSQGLADQPVVGSLTPIGFQRGTEVEWKIGGARLDDAYDLLFYEEGIELLELQTTDANNVVARLKIADDCQPGLHSFRLAARGGLSDVRFFGVSALPQIDEVEPNNDVSIPQLVPLNCTVNGLCQNEDVDYYAVDLEAGQKLTIELEGLRLGTDFFDPFIAILDENRFELARSDDAPLLQQDCVCSYTAEKAGRYLIEVRESSFGGNDRAKYRLHVGDFPRPLAIVPGGGRPGETIRATLVDVSGELWHEDIVLPDALGEFQYTAVRDGKLAPSPNRLRVVDLPNVMESEPDEDHRALTAHVPPLALNGVLEAPGDVDWFKVDARKDQTLEFMVYARRVLRSPLDSWLEIYNANGARLAANDDLGGPDSFLSFKIPEDGEYLIAIRDQLNDGSPMHAYRIEVAPPTASLALGIDELQRYISQTMEVPRGAQMAVILRANRKNFGGELDVRLDNAPAGLELLTPKVPANAGFIPLMIRAKPDAEVSASLAELTAETLPGGPGVKGGLEQRTMLVRGQNNVDVWGHDARHLAVAVTDELPFTISVDQPRVPLVRNGNMHYVVRAHRQEGYTEPISLRVLYNPSGCSASGSIRIEGDQQEALIPVTANDKATIGNFPIAVLARVKARNEAVWVSTEFINLEVADSFFDFKFPTTVAETGRSENVVVGLTVKSPPQGEVEFELVGLPAGVTSSQPKVRFVEGMEQLAFPIDVAEDARVGQFKMLVVHATITRPEGQIVQTQGTGEIQIVAPVVAAVAASTPSAPPPATTAEKPLSRLEQLRQAKGVSTRE